MVCVMSLKCRQTGEILCSVDQQLLLQDWLRSVCGEQKAEITFVEKLSGGAIQQNWLIELARAHPESHPLSLVLRCDAPSQLGVSHHKSDEAHLLKLLFENGVSVPEIMGWHGQSDIIGKPFFVMRHVGGEAQARRWVRHPEKNIFGEKLVFQLGREMAKLHQITPKDTEFAFMPAPLISPEQQALDEVRSILDRVDEVHPVLEFAFHWLQNRCDEWHDGSPLSLCHRDFRIGNFLIENYQLAAVLDWEFSRFSVAAEDIGWLCARCWRFGADRLVVGGLADYPAFEAGYMEIAENPISHQSIRYWQIYAELRWAAIALEQAWRCHTGGEISLELALSAPLAAEMEYNLLALIARDDTKNPTSLR